MSRTIEHKILMFGIAREIAETSLYCLDLPTGSTIADLREQLCRNLDGLRELKTFMIARNNEYADDSEEIQVGDELAIIPPVSGG